MTRDTLILLGLIAVLALLGAVLILQIVDAMALAPPDVDTTVRVTGAVELGA